MEEKFTVPSFLHDMLLFDYGEESARIEAGYQSARPVTLRANTLKTTAEEVERALSALGIASERVPWYADAFILFGVREAELSRTELYETGKIYLQSLSSMLPPLFLAPRGGETVLDMTAAPGGKTTQLAALSGGKALITACERDRVRFERLKFNLARQGAGRVNAMQTDAGKLDDFFRFDKILLDAPCSGSGTLGEGRTVISEALIEGCLRSQERLLRKALKLLKRGGTLIYSTCSVLKRENEGMLERVLKGSDCRLQPLIAPDALPRLKSAEGTLTVCPDGLFEGFFLAKIVK